MSIEIRFLNTDQLRGVELVDGVARLCCMNLVLHGIGSDAAHVPVQVKDALAGKHGEMTGRANTNTMSKSSNARSPHSPAGFLTTIQSSPG